MKGGTNMLKANLEAELEAAEKSLYSVNQDLQRIDHIIDGLSKQMEILRINKVSLETKIDDLRDQMEVE